MAMHSADEVLVDTAMDKVLLALVLVAEAGHELNEALLLVPGSDGLEHIEGLVLRAASGLRSELRIAGRSETPAAHVEVDGPTFWPTSAGYTAASHRFACGECGFSSHDFEPLQQHVYGAHLGAAV